MILTDEKSEIIASYLIDNPERAQKLYEMTSEEAAKEINMAGYDFTAEEIAEFGRQLSIVTNVSAAEDGELDISAAENITGGSVAFYTGLSKLIFRNPITIPVLPKKPLKWI